MAKTKYRRLADIEKFRTAKQTLVRCRAELRDVAQELADVTQDIPDRDEQIATAAADYLDSGATATLTDPAAVITEKRELLESKQAILQAAERSAAQACKAVKQDAVRELMAERRPEMQKRQLAIAAAMRQLADAHDAAREFRAMMMKDGLQVGSASYASVATNSAPHLRQQAAAIERAMQ